MDKIPKPGEFYKHFKNRMYQILAIATHSETGEQMVVYQALYGSFAVYVRPLDMFLEPVDKEKYPEANQALRFEQTIPEGDKTMEPDDVRTAEEENISSLLMDFLDERDIGKQIEILQQMKGCATRQEVESLYLSQDLRMDKGSEEELLEELIQYLRMQQRYDASRLRRR